jgi:ankyrin repeat protein
MLADSAGLTPLNYAAAAGSEQLFDLLLQGKPWAAAAAGSSSSSSCADAKAVAAESDRQLLQLAVAAGSLELVKVLLDGGELNISVIIIIHIGYLDRRLQTLLAVWSW